MDISRISYHSAQASSVSITTPTAGDLILVFAHRDASTTAPSLPSGYTNIHNGSSGSGGTSNSARLFWKFSAGNETSVAATNATSIVVQVYRGHDRHVPIGAYAFNGSSSATITFGALTLHSLAGSWVAAFAGHRTATNVGGAVTNLTLNTSATDCAGWDTNGAVTSWSQQTLGVNATAQYRSYTVEIRAAQTTVPSPDLMVQHVWSEPTEQNANAIKIFLPQACLAGNALVLGFTHTTGESVTSVQDNNGTNWTLGASITNGGGYHDSRAYYLLNAPATTKYVVVTFASVCPEFNFCLTEFRGVKSVSAVDGTSTAATTTTHPVRSGAITTTANGDLIYQYSQAVQQASFTNNSACLGIAPEGGFVLLHAGLRTVHAAQYGVQAAAGSINPGLTFRVPSNPDSFNTLTMAFQVDGSGTAPSGMRIVRHGNHSPIATAATEKVQFATHRGNLLIAGTSNSFTQIQFPPSSPPGQQGVIDTKGNAYTRVALTVDAPQLHYAANATPSLDLALTVNQNPAGNFVRLWEIEGADASPYDTAADAYGTKSGTVPPGGTIYVNNAPVITPGVSDGMSIAIMAFGTGPIATVESPAGAILDDSPYSGEDDLGNMNYGDAYAHYRFTSNAQQVWNWTHLVASQETGYNAQVVTFKAASSGASVSGAQTYPAYTQGASGTPILSASAGQTQAAYSQSAGAAPTASASAAQTLAAYSQNATAGSGETAQASAAQTYPAYTQGATANSTIPASAAQNESAESQAAAATPILQASGAQTYPVYSQTAASTPICGASAAQNEGLETPSANAAPIIAVSASQAEGLETPSASATGVIQASAAQTCDVYAQAATVDAGAAAPTGYAPGPLLVSRRNRVQILQRRAAVPSSTVECSAAQTYSAYSQTATANPIITASAAQTYSAYSQNAQAAQGEIAQASAAQTYPAYSQGAAGTPIAAASAAQNEAAESQNAAANSAIQASAAQTEGAEVQAASISITAQASAAQTYPAYAQNAQAVQGEVAQASAAQTYPAYSQAATAAPVSVASAAQTEALESQTAAGAPVLAASAAQTGGAEVQSATARTFLPVAAAQTYTAYSQAAAVSTTIQASASTLLLTYSQAAFAVPGQTEDGTVVRHIGDAAPIRALASAAPWRKVGDASPIREVLQ